MAAFQTSAMICLGVFLICSGLQLSTGCTVFQSLISCSPGESVLLSCGDAGHSDVQWFYSEFTSVTAEYSVFPAEDMKARRFKDRVQIHRNHSLSITHLTVDDTGKYRCISNTVQLTVEGCYVLGNERSAEVSRYSAESVFLSCLIKCTTRHTLGSEFRWKLPNHREINDSAELKKLDGGRFHMCDTNSGNLSLLISDLTEEDEGLYSCWIDENQHKSFNLIIKDPKDLISNIPTYSLIFLICLMLILLVTGCIYFRFTKVKEGRSRRVIQRPDDEDTLTYSTVTHIKGRKPAEKQQQDDVIYARVSPNNSEAVGDFTYSPMVNSKPKKPEDSSIYTTVQKD